MTREYYNIYPNFDDSNELVEASICKIYKGSISLT